MEGMWSVSGMKWSRVIGIWLHIGQWQKSNGQTVSKTGGSPGTGFPTWLQPLAGQPRRSHFP